MGLRLESFLSIGVQDVDGLPEVGLDVGDDFRDGCVKDGRVLCCQGLVVDCRKGCDALRTVSLFEVASAAVAQEGGHR